MKSITVEELIQESQQYEDTLVMMDGCGFYPVVMFKCIRWEDCEFGGGDYFYQYITFDGEKGSLSCVGRMIPLVDKLDKKDYNALVYTWNYNFKSRYEETIIKEKE